ncbi:hypothetical protein [Candidatus Solirubrobacter pratensis]|uniref:hypothetical protein n=1 Tax=Candidatus Solirubrobacter pratensis TaxID=1298857 RepID=UPI0003F5E33D|nr:hypothetical protein [Candidatus Solirubrobacter pratensis]
MTQYTSEEDAERLHAEVKAAAIGPLGSAVMLGPDGVYVFFKVRWSDTMRRVTTLAVSREDINSESRWSFFREPHAARGEFSLVLEIQWPEVEERAVLYFEWKQWHVELEQVERNGGLIALCPEAARGHEMLRQGLYVEVATDVLTAVRKALARVTGT